MRVLVATAAVLALTLGAEGFMTSCLPLSCTKYASISKLNPLRPPVQGSQRRGSNAGFLGRVGMKLGALLFACDGVIADTECDGHRLALNMAFKECGLSMTASEEQYEKLLHIRGVERLERFWAEIGWKDMTVDTALKVYKRKSEIFQKLVEDGKVPLRAGIKTLIKEAIDAKIAVAVCSSSNQAQVKGIVSQLGSDIAGKIHVFTGDQVPRRKPAPDVYLAAQIKLGVAPEECVVFEDNHDGLEAATKAGMACIITKSKYTKKDKFPEASLEVDDLTSGEVNLERVAGIAFNMQGLNA